jgi:hypothetical protein
LSHSYNQRKKIRNANGKRRCDDSLLKTVEGLSKIILAPDAEMWLLNLTHHKLNEFVPIHQQGLDNTQSLEAIQHTLDKKLKGSKGNQATLASEDITRNQANHDRQSFAMMLPVTRSRRNHTDENSVVDTPSAGAVLGEDQEGASGRGRVAPVTQGERVRWERRPREPLPHLEDISAWVGKQLDRSCEPPGKVSERATIRITYTSGRGLS